MVQMLPLIFRPRKPCRALRKPFCSMQTVQGVCAVPVPLSGRSSSPASSCLFLSRQSSTKASPGHAVPSVSPLDLLPKSSDLTSKSLLSLTRLFLLCLGAKASTVQSIVGGTAIQLRFPFFKWINRLRGSSLPA